MELFNTLFFDYTFLIVALGSMLIGITSGAIGSFVVLKRQSLLGDGISHSALAGVTAVFLLTGKRNTAALLTGAFITGLLAVFTIHIITRYTKIAFDSALALIMSVLFGLGLVLLSHAQKYPNAAQAGLKYFIYGQAFALLPSDVLLIAFIGSIQLLFIALFWKELKIYTFDAEYARLSGFPPSLINGLLSVIITITIVIGLQTVGSLLMSALITIPAAAARQWSKNLWQMVVLSAIFGGISGFTGTAASSLLPHMPTGPAVVLCISLIAGFSLLAAPKRGIFSKYKQKHAKYREEV